MPQKRGIVRANLLITCDPNHMGKAQGEIESLFQRIGHGIEFLDSGVPGLFQTMTKNPREAVRELAELCRNEPICFEASCRYVPVENWCKANVKDMKEVIMRLAKEIDDDASWKMQLSRRMLKGSTPELILALTEAVCKPNVDLENPDLIIQIEVVGNLAGISLLSAEEVLNVAQAKKLPE